MWCGRCRRAKTTNPLPPSVETGGATEWLVRGAELVRGAGELVITVLLLVTGEDDGGGLVGGTSLVEGGLVGVLDGD
jgi:hypothetical protein